MALLGMVGTHLLDQRDPLTGELALGQALAGGRASALFAVLAGVTLALATGRRTPPRGRERVAASAGLVVRALLIAAVGLLLAEAESGLAVILTYYGLLFLLGLPFVGLGARALLGLAAVWTVVTPVLSHLVRPELPERGFSSPQLEQLAEPGRLVSELAFTGYYPVVPWLAYLLAGMALGRMDLSRRRLQAALAVGGGAVAVAATVVSHALTRRADVTQALLAEPPSAGTGPELLDRISTGLAGTTPTGGAWQWLLVVAPHSGTPFDIAQTIGSALLVVGLCLLVVGSLPAVAERAVAVLFGAGTMTLSLYSLHVLMRTPEVWPREQPGAFWLHAVVLLGIGAWFAAWRQRGPLERVVGGLAGAAVSGLSPRR
ncbi:DUF1624 domain-containing protein [Nocardioides sp. MJB4]|uniref:DUF1624 domain-containing protein n=1 Tax=Nocardioides donggukensis TaxID=2774019 RepID=A0A927PZ95_9ACTN|nr:DUF1624 domain-containing protein [Nocardioides donggukensis]